MVKIFFTEEFGKAFVPKKAIPGLRQYLFKAGITKPPYQFFGATFYITLLVTLAVYFLVIQSVIVNITNSVAFFSSPQALWEFLLTFVSIAGMLFLFVVLFILCVYFYLDLRIYARTKQLEDLLPDYLQIVSSNLKGGLTFENALWAGIKPRFKVLANEMAEVSKKVMTGYEVRTALDALANKYDSPMLRRSVDLMISEFESGGNITELLDHLVEHLKEMKDLKNELSANAITYVIFISVIIVFVSPLLFALAYNLLIIILNFVGDISAATQRVPNVPFQFSGGNINIEDFKIFSYVTITIISFFASIIVSIVERGSVKSGLKYIPLFVFGSLFFYYIFINTLTSLFGNVV